MSDPRNPSHGYTEGYEEQWASRELQEERVGQECCRRCGGTGRVAEGQSGVRMLSLALVWLAMAGSFLVLGFGLGRWTTL